MGNCWIPLSGLKVVLLEEDSSAVVRWIPKKVASREDARWKGFMFQAGSRNDSPRYICRFGRECGIMTFGICVPEKRRARCDGLQVFVRCGFASAELCRCMLGTRRNQVKFDHVLTR